MSHDGPVEIDGHVVDPTDGEPVLRPAVITGFVAAVLALAVSFGLDLTPAQQAAITGLAAWAAPLIAAWVARRRAWSPRSVVELVQGRERR